MRIEGKEIELPLLMQNPFSTAPLEKSQKNVDQIIYQSILGI